MRLFPNGKWENRCRRHRFSFQEEEGEERPFPQIAPRHIKQNVCLGSGGEGREEIFN